MNHSFLPPPPAERIIKQKETLRGIDYLVRWKGYSADEDTWQPTQDVKAFAPAILDEWKQRRKRDNSEKASRKKRHKTVAQVDPVGFEHGHHVRDVLRVSLSGQGQLCALVTWKDGDSAVPKSLTVVQSKVPTADITHHCWGCAKSLIFFYESNVSPKDGQEKPQL